ncbi:MAG: hypothetical protein QNJ65_04480 [Xenococcaceae cyanobacterium MO_234.B1]|nr:hypothetical protein [Xenococcaceae cyanobacterium MO_234.B1]
MPSADQNLVSTVQYKTKLDREKAIAFLDKGQAVIPIWLDTIHQKLQKKLL